MAGRLDAKQVIKDIYDPTNNDLSTQNVAQVASGGSTSLSKLSWQQILRDIHESSSSDIRVVEVI